MIRFYEALRRGDEKGFTLIELLIVVAVIAILAVIAIPNFLNARKKATFSASKANMKNIATAIETYQADNDSYPYDGGGVASLTSSASLGLVTTYINRMPTDPVGGGNYLYDSNGALGTATQYVLYDPHNYSADSHRNGAGAGATALVRQGGEVVDMTSGTYPPTPTP